eukprot:Nitzschia sp. Nitz4//scaffold29_size155292//115585//116142//NITZ4_002679-RA/size155292-exonerate_protein2genome-gene-0.24-mRNA-1//1//CDS//3329546511//436//frame0
MKGVVSWLPCGTGFQIHNRSVFVNIVLPRYFENTKYKSFIRQLNLYKFHRCAVGNKQRVRGAYRHPKFQRDHPDLLAELKRDSSIFKEIGDSSSSSSYSKKDSLEDTPQHGSCIKASQFPNNARTREDSGLNGMLTWARSQLLLQPFSLLDCQASPPKDEILQEIVKTFGSTNYQQKNAIAGGVS